MPEELPRIYDLPNAEEASFQDISETITSVEDLETRVGISKTEVTPELGNLLQGLIVLANKRNKLTAKAKGSREVASEFVDKRNAAFVELSKLVGYERAGKIDKALFSAKQKE